MRFDPRRWLDVPAHIERHGQVSVVRDDLLEGGSKIRFLPFLVQGASEIVFGGPFCGGAPLALSVLGRESGQKVTLFYAARNQLHRRQQTAKTNGALLKLVRPGYMTVVQARARAYADKAGALFLPLGFDVPEAEHPFGEAISRVRKQVGSPDEVWCVAGSGMLARCLGWGFPESQIMAVAVGLKSRHEKQAFPDNVRIIDQPLKFEQEEKSFAPFPSCPNYDLKAWPLLKQEEQRFPSRSRLMWNVLS